jgi:hypothetical protein
MFTDYYVSFADSYVGALEKSRAEVNTKDTSAIAYMLMGISNFLGLKAIFENMGPGDIDKMMDEAVMPMLASGVFKKPEADNNC